VFPRDIVCLRNISISTLHKGDDDDDDDDFQECPVSESDPVSPALVFTTVSKNPQKFCPEQQQPATKERTVIAHTISGCHGATVVCPVA
jgi:hypothetical protein